MTIAQFTFQGPENKECSAEVSAEEGDGDLVHIIYALTWDNETKQFPIEFNTEAGTINLSNLAVPLPAYVWCLVTCGLGHLATEILDCWRKGHRSPSALFHCLRGKGHSIASGLSNCAISCLSSIGGGTP